MGIALSYENEIISVPPKGTILHSFNEIIFDGEVIDRPNRFLVNVKTAQGVLKCHLHDPGRLKELIFPGNKVLCRPTNGIKTNHSVTAARDKDQWILTDTRVHSDIASFFLPSDVQREVTIGKHRMDFRYGNTLIEVKGCTMLKDGIATFPDAPTKRGTEHLQVLMENLKAGKDSLLIILVFRKNAVAFMPNEETDPDFSREFKLALKKGVRYFIPILSFENGSVVYWGNIDPIDEYRR